MHKPREAHKTLQFLKLGGSLITDKHLVRTPRMDVLNRLAGEIAAALRAFPELQLVLGNGAGSYGHVSAQKYGTRHGVHSPEEWRGFTEIWKEAATLNHLVTDALQAVGLPAIAIHPSSAVMACEGRVLTWDLAPLQAALDAGLIPVVHGDVIFDRCWGGTILSTEDLFAYLALQLRPRRILLAGLEAGVWEDFPACTALVEEITPTNIAAILPALGGSRAADVTGGMASKVQQSLALVEKLPELEVVIFSGETPGAVQQALSGARLGTRIHRVIVQGK